MARKEGFDFNCPQYVDFLAGLESNSEDLYFDCCDNPSQLDEKSCENLPEPKNDLTEAAENKCRLAALKNRQICSCGGVNTLVNKMTAALSVIENTPKLKMGMVRGKLFPEKASMKNVGNHLVEPIIKSSTVHRPSARMRSKSVCVAHTVHTDKPNKAREFRPKRSSSLSDLRTIKKHGTYAKTPLCLKRTIKAKTKVFKTTEEMELEQIAELQKQLSQLLRDNEISYKKFKLRQRPCIQKNMENKPEKAKGNAGISTDKNTRRNFHAMSHTAMKRETMKLDSVINSKASSSKAPKNLLKDILEKSKNPSVSSSIISDECDKNKDQVPKKHLKIKYGFHSGLVFCDNVKKSTVVKPFSFDARNVCTDQKAEVSLTKSVSKHNVNDGKENFQNTKSKSVVQNVSRQPGSNKKIVRQLYGNPVRGLPLAENSLRN